MGGVLDFRFREVAEGLEEAAESDCVLFGGGLDLDRGGASLVGGFSLPSSSSLSFSSPSLLLLLGESSSSSSLYLILFRLSRREVRRFGRLLDTPESIFLSLNSSSLPLEASSISSLDEEWRSPSSMVCEFCDNVLDARMDDGAMSALVIA